MEISSGLICWIFDKLLWFRSRKKHDGEVPIDISARFNPDEILFIEAIISVTNKTNHTVNILRYDTPLVSYKCKPHIVKDMYVEPSQYEDFLNRCFPIELEAGKRFEFSLWFVHPEVKKAEFKVVRDEAGDYRITIL